MIVADAKKYGWTASVVGPIVLDADTLATLAAEDETTQVVRPKKRWGRRIAIAVVVVALIAGVGVGSYFTVLNPKNPVPGLIGLTEAEARNQVSPFGWGVVVKKERSDQVQAGQIIRTNPVLGANLAKRRAAHLGRGHLAAAVVLGGRCAPLRAADWRSRDPL